MDSTTDVGQGLPLAASLPVIVAISLWLVFLMRRAPSAAMRFVLFAVSLRIILSALHELTFLASPLGVTWTALASIGAVAIGLFVLRRRSVLDPALIPFWPLLLALIASGAYNAEVGPLITVLTKYAYLIVLLLAVQEALENLGPSQVFRLLPVPFCIALALQAESVLLGVAKAGESDGSASYIGGFHHEAAFSVVLAAGVLIVSLRPDRRILVKFGALAIGLVALLLANYRTSALAVLPILAVTFLTDIPRRFVAGQRALLAGLAAIAVACAGLAGAIVARDRLADVAVAATQGSSLIKRPDLFSDSERRVMSGRPKIWSEYIYGWVDASPERQMIGHGPESWIGTFDLYAHNTVISMLYETGVIGVAALIFLWMWMFGLALLVHGEPRLPLAAAHVSFFVLNMATMPMWMIEGMIFYAILCGYTLCCFAASRLTIRNRPFRLGIPRSQAGIAD